MRLKPGEGLVGAAVTSQMPLLVNDVVGRRPRYVQRRAGHGVRAGRAAAATRSGRSARSTSSATARTSSRASDVELLRQFAAHVSVGIVNARLFERSRSDADAFETLAEIGRDVASVLDLDELFARIAQSMRRLIDYRTFGIWLLERGARELEIKHAVHYGDHIQQQRIPLGEGLVGYAALHGEPVLVADVSQDPRYINVVADVRSELAIPMLLKDRCIGVLDLESPELDAFTKRDVEILTLLASQAAVAIENARLYETVRANEVRLEKEMHFAQRVQAALLPVGLPKRMKGVDVGARFAPARELGGDFHDFLSPESNMLAVALGDVSGKGVPAALYSVFAAELIRGRTFRRRYLPDRSGPASVLSSVNTILHQRQLEEYYCTLCYAIFDLKRRDRHARELRPAVSDPRVGGRRVADRAAGRAARLVPGIDLRRADLRAARRGSVRVLQRRRVRGDEREWRGVRRGAADRDGRSNRASSRRARSWTRSSTPSRPSATASRRTTT